MKSKNLILETLLVLVLVSAVFLVYSSNLHGPFIFDDSRIYNTTELQVTELSLESILKAGLESKPRTRPVAYISFAVNHSLHGLETTGYHLVNIAIHALTAVFLYLFLKTTLSLPVLESRYKGYWLLPFAAALIWAVHPLQTQSVTYIVQRMNSMASLFYVLALYLYVKGRLTEKAGLKWLLFFFTLASFLLAIGSKETAATLPFFIFLYEWFFLQDLDRSWLRKQVVPLLVILLCFSALVFVYMGKNPFAYITGTYGGRDFTLAERVLTQFRVIFFYITLLLFPHPDRLNLDHNFTLSTGLFSPASTAAAAVFLLLLLLFSLFSARKHRLVSFCLLWFMGNLVIESSVIGLEIIFEHRNYLPSMMMVLLVLAAVFSLLRHKAAVVVFTCAVVLLFSFWTFERNKVWTDRVTLWGDCAQKSPEKARPHNNLAVALKKQGRLNEAIEHLKKTVELDPRFFEAYNNLGNTYSMLGSYQEAVKYYKMGLKITPNNPLLHINTGMALAKDGQLMQALLHFGQALSIQPDNEQARMHFLSTQMLLNAGENMPSRQ